MYIETTSSAFERDGDATGENYKIEQVDRNESEVRDAIADDQPQTLSYPNETLETDDQKPIDSDTEKGSTGGTKFIKNRWKLLDCSAF